MASTKKAATKKKKKAPAGKRRAPIADAEGKRLLRDFAAWSGGFGPDYCDWDSEVRKYAKVAAPAEFGGPARVGAFLWKVHNRGEGPAFQEAFLHV